ncbi:MAG: 50S ribosomal protein L23 [Candidatus Bathyarchaeia archaeon]
MSVVEMHRIILYPLITEEAVGLIERENKLVFIVNKKVSRSDVKNAVEQLYEVKVRKVNTLITAQGQKKAFVTLTPEHSASDLAIKLGIL